MRERLLNAGSEAVDNAELLEMTLYLALPRRDTISIARELLAKFNSFQGAIAAPKEDLLRIKGLGKAGVAALKTVQIAALRLAREEILNQPILRNWEKLMAYLNLELARERVEHFRVLFLDGRNHLLADEALARGTVDHTPVYPREVVKRSLELHATALILVHNHPSGDPSPSRPDVEMTKEVSEAVGPIGVVVHDHVIVGNGKWLSLRQAGLL
jgi:DNA repair protein RadC